MARPAPAASLLAAIGLALAGCGGVPANDEVRTLDAIAAERGGTTSTFGDLFRNNDDPNTTLEVNRYIWVAAQDVLSFLPIESSDPFSGVLVYGFGVPPGGSRAYRATVFVRDPALDARSLSLALATRAGPAAPDTVRAVEDAILTRARQLRLQDEGL